jgi:hypothetical protein
MTDDIPLPLDGAASRLGRRMLELARAINADVPPRVLEARHITSVAGTAVVIVWCDLQAEFPIAITVNVMMAESETISEIVHRLQSVRPRLDAPSLH